MSFNEDQELQIKNLAENIVWQDTTDLYNKYRSKFDIVSQRLQKQYKLDDQTAKEAVIYELMSSQYGKKKNLEIYSLKWILLYMLLFLYLAVSSIISLLLYGLQKTVKVDIVFEEMWHDNSLYKRFYQYIDTQMKKVEFKKVLLLLSPSFKVMKKNVSGYNGNIVNRRYASIIFDFKIIIRVFKDFSFLFRLHNLSKETKINFIYLYLRLLRKILMYYSQGSKLQARVLISAADYYWTPLKYFMYKRSISNIILIQNNYVGEYLHLRLFQYCDYYYAHSKQSIAKHHFCGNAKFFNVGSFQLIPFLQEEKIEYDIAFISQTVYDNLTVGTPLLDQRLLQENYIKLKENFHKYLQENPSIKAVYITKLGYDMREPACSDKIYFENLANIKFIAAAGRDTFNIISKSRLVLNMYSSLGFESYGLDKRVLWINYDHCCDPFKYDTNKEEMHIMINDKSYTAFKEKVDILLSNDETVEKHYSQLKEDYMSINGNPAIQLIKQVEDLLERCDK